MTKQWRGRGLFLVVDDDVVALEVSRERLEDAGFSVVTRNKALGTSAYIRTEKPDYVLLDVHMPGLPGDALAKLLSDRDFETKIILHSATHKDQLVSLASACGAIGVIEKTDDDQAFLAQLQRCLQLEL
jgi:two-component system alkaline phosphatase synthesis response regulator PhoP